MDLVGGFILLLIGFLCAAAAEFLALFLAGAGHGWVAPLFYSLFLFVPYPYVFLRTVGEIRHWVAADVLLLAAGIVADISLARDTYLHEAIYFVRAMEMPPLAIIWMAIWAAWQLVTAYRIYRAFARRGADTADAPPDPEMAALP